MSKLPILYVDVDDPPFCGAVKTFTTREGDLLGKQYILILEATEEWLGYQPGQEVQFIAPSEAFWKECLEAQEVTIYRHVPEGAKIAQYRLGDPVAPSVPVPAPDLHMESYMLDDKQASRIWMAAMDKAAKMVQYHNQRYPDLVMLGDQVASIAMSLVIAHNRSEIRLEPFNPDA